MMSPSNTLRLASLIVAGGLFLPAGASAQSSGSMMVDVGPCIRLESAIQRFACYEQQVENTLTGTTQAYQPLVVPGTEQSRAAPPAAPAPMANVPPSAPPAAPLAAGATAAALSAPTAPPAAVSNPEASFGLQEESRRQRDDIEELNSTITELKETVPNAYIISLANGQVWRQVRPDSGYRLKVGHDVRIYPSRWGNDYRLSATDLRGFIQVERIE